MKKIKFIDLFSGIGGFRLGFESACKSLNIDSECVFSSEIKKEAVDTYKINFSENNILGDITKIKASEIPNFDVLLAGFPCQSFSSAGSRKGFLDTRGTLFFDIQRILKEKKPKGFILENVEGLINHDRENVKESIGNTLSIILKILESLNYKVSYSLLNSKNFGLAQDRNRIFIVGTKKNLVSLEGSPQKVNSMEIGICDNLKNFKGGPLESINSVTVSSMNGLVNFVGIPRSGQYSLSYNRINSFKGLPNHINSLKIIDSISNKNLIRKSYSYFPNRINWLSASSMQDEGKKTYSRYLFSRILNVFPSYIGNIQDHIPYLSHPHNDETIINNFRFMRTMVKTLILLVIMVYI
jgi:DNA-cytosine methyltransferase